MLPVCEMQKHGTAMQLGNVLIAFVHDLSWLILCGGAKDWRLSRLRLGERPIFLFLKSFKMFILDMTFWSFTLIKILFRSCHLNKSVFPKSHCEINLSSTGIHEQRKKNDPEKSLWSSQGFTHIQTSVHINRWQLNWHHRSINLSCVSTRGARDSTTHKKAPVGWKVPAQNPLTVWWQPWTLFFFFFSSCILIVRIEAVNSTRPLKWLWVNRRVSHPASSESSCSFCIAPPRQWMTSALVSSC